MSDQSKPAEIEDVLSSIRKLVSGGAAGSSDRSRQTSIEEWEDGTPPLQDQAGAPPTTAEAPQGAQPDPEEQAPPEPADHDAAAEVPAEPGMPAEDAPGQAQDPAADTSPARPAFLLTEAARVTPDADHDADPAQETNAIESAETAGSAPAPADPQTGAAEPETETSEGTSSHPARQGFGFATIRRDDPARHVPLKDLDQEDASIGDNSLDTIESDLDLDETDSPPTPSRTDPGGASPVDAPRAHGPHPVRSGPVDHRIRLARDPWQQPPAERPADGQTHPEPAQTDPSPEVAAPDAEAPDAEAPDTAPTEDMAAGPQATEDPTLSGQSAEDPSAIDQPTQAPATDETMPAERPIAKAPGDETPADQEPDAVLPGPASSEAGATGASAEAAVEDRQASGAAEDVEPPSQSRDSPIWEVPAYGADKVQPDEEKEGTASSQPAAADTPSFRQDTTATSAWHGRSPVNLFGDDETGLDEEALRALIAEVVHRELQGTLGQRVSGNIRSLVRREIAKALEERGLE